MDGSTSYETQVSAQPARLLRVVLLAWIVVVVVRNAWLSDDAFISFRTVENFVHGRGLTWNPGQRVQAFTHPAWLFVVSAAHLFTNEIYYTVLALSLSVAGFGLWWATRWLARDDLSVIPALTALTFSRAFVDYSTSGLENVLSHALLWFIAAAAARPAAVSGVRRFELDLGCGLLALNRLDLVLLAAPTWAWAMWRRRSNGVPTRRLLQHAAVFAAPLLAWWIFAIFYFGFALPNTAYAKLGIDIPFADRAAQGFFYLLLVFAGDPVSALLLLVAIGLCASVLREAWQRPMLLGVVLYLVYILFIGGDFMAGRFVSAPVVAATAVLLRARLDRAYSFGLAALFALVGATGTAPPPMSGTEAEGRTGTKVEFRRYRIVDERRYYYHETGLLSADRLRPMPSGRYRDAGKKLTGKRGIVAHQIGMYAFHAGPSAALIDPFALTDPFLARIKPQLPADGDWIAGHWERPIPDGYRKTIKHRRNMLTDTKLAKLYDHMNLITSGPLWSFERLQAIWRLNTGQYDWLAQRHVEGTQSDDDVRETPQ